MVQCVERRVLGKVRRISPTFAPGGNGHAVGTEQLHAHKQGETQQRGQGACVAVVKVHQEDGGHRHVYDGQDHPAQRSVVVLLVPPVQ